VQLKTDIDIPLNAFQESDAFKVIQKYQRQEKEDEDRDAEGDQSAPPHSDMLALVRHSHTNPDQRAQRERAPAGSGQDEAGQEGWRMTRRAFFVQPPQPITKQVDRGKPGQRPQEYFLYGRRVAPILTVPATLVDFDLEKAKAWFHAELVEKAVEEMRELPSTVLEEYGL
jgi:hypothetical protein